MSYTSLSGVNETVPIDQLIAYMVDRVMNYKVGGYVSINSLIGYLPVGDLIRLAIQQEVTKSITNAMDLQDKTNTDTVAYQIASGMMQQILFFVRDHYPEKLQKAAEEDYTIGDIFDLYDDPALLAAVLSAPGSSFYNYIVGTSPSNPGKLTRFLSDTMENFADDVLGFEPQQGSAWDTTPSSDKPSWRDRFSDKPVDYIEREEYYGGITTAPGGTVDRGGMVATPGKKLPILPLAAAGVAALILMSK